MDRVIDLRSDTVTRPTPAMREAMAQAEVGDDVIDADPTVDRLQQRIAEMLGKEAALYMPSGTMCNQVAVRLHCRPGDELICEAGCHIYNYEQGGYAQLSGATTRTVVGRRGVMSVQQLEDLIHPDDEHHVRTQLVCLENTHNRGGGTVLPLDGVRRIGEWARQNGLATHLDGARLFNAVVASGVPADQWAAPFDTVSVCFSKGLGAPVGSALAGSAEAMRRARRHRKVLGGGMRQAGIIAAGALFALQHHIERLAVDHQNARLLAQLIAQTPGFKLDIATVETNLVIFELEQPSITADALCRALAERGVLTLPFGRYQIRACTHLDVGADDVQRAGEIMREVAKPWS
jgi:threonine aldolase